MIIKHLASALVLFCVVLLADAQSVKEHSHIPLKKKKPVVVSRWHGIVGTDSAAMLGFIVRPEYDFVFDTLAAHGLSNNNLMIHGDTLYLAPVGSAEWHQLRDERDSGLGNWGKPWWYYQYHDTVAICMSINKKYSKLELAGKLMDEFYGKMIYLDREIVPQIVDGTGYAIIKQPNGYKLGIGEGWNYTSVNIDDDEWRKLRIYLLKVHSKK